MKKKIVYKFLASYILVILVSIFLLSLFVRSRVTQYSENQIAEELKSNAFLISTIIREDVYQASKRDIQSKIEVYAKELSCRITVIAEDGTVLGETEKDSSLMGNHLNRREVAEALAEGSGESARLSDTLGVRMKYAAMPIILQDKSIGVVRLAIPLLAVKRELNIIHKVFILGAVFTVCFTLLIGFFLSRSISLPIQKIEETAAAIAAGDFGRRVAVNTNDELGDLSKSLNRMADELQSEMDKLEKLDRVRTDFVANVSHELKTPLTAIRGYIETLEDGAVEDTETSYKFLGIINNHTKRLSNILDDLLRLAEIENVENVFEAVTFDVKSMIDDVVWQLTSAISEKHHNLGVDYNGKDFDIRGDKNKIERVLVNLIDNAVKYTSEEGRIEVALFEQKDNILITIKDDGIGIPEEHLNRIFERFYRVDSSRSRELGGTGLGLSIVKHIVLMHKGHIDIESVVGQGTKISIVLPRDFEE